MCLYPHVPIGHDHPLETPFLAQYVLKKLRVLRAVSPVETVVTTRIYTLGRGLHNIEYENLRGHVRPRLRVLLGKHERQEIDLPQSSFGDDTVVCHAVILFVVGTIKTKWDERE